MNLDDTNFLIFYMLMEIALLMVLFIVGRLVQLLANMRKKPYVVRDEYDPYLASAYIFRIQRYGNRYVEYKFRNVDGSWKPVIDKRSLIYIAILALILFGIMLGLAGFKGFLVLGVPLLIYTSALTATQYYEAYRLLMQN